MQTLNKIVTENETPVCGFLGPQFLIMVDKPEDIQTVISSKGCFEKGQMYRFIKRTLGLFAAPYHIWKPQRKQLSTSFNLSIIQSFVPIFNSKADLLVRNVGKEIGKGDFDLTKYTSPCTLDIVCGKFKFPSFFSFIQWNWSRRDCHGISDGNTERRKYWLHGSLSWVK